MKTIANLVPYLMMLIFNARGNEQGTSHSSWPSVHPIVSPPRVLRPTARLLPYWIRCRKRITSLRWCRHDSRAVKGRRHRLRRRRDVASPSCVRRRWVRVRLVLVRLHGGKMTAVIRLLLPRWLGVCCSISVPRRRCVARICLRGARDNARRSRATVCAPVTPPRCCRGAYVRHDHVPPCACLVAVLA